MRKLRVPAHCEKCCHGGGEEGRRGGREEKGRGPRHSGKQHTGHKIGNAEEFSGGLLLGPVRWAIWCSLIRETARALTQEHEKVLENHRRMREALGGGRTAG